MACEGERIRGVLPLFLVKNVLLGRVLLSSPFAVYGGALVDSEDAKDALRSAVRSLAESLKVDYVELRNAHPEQALGFERISRYVTFTQVIGPDEEQILNDIPRKVRYMVRKSCKPGYAVERFLATTSAFEDLYAQSLRRLGTPAFPRRYFKLLFENYTGSIDIREISLDGMVIAAVLTLYFRDQVLPYYGASDRRFNADAPNNFMYFDLMRWAGRNGYRLFDFGRSKKGFKGSYEFKAHWGMTERELPYEMLLVRRKQLPNFSPANPLFDLPMKIWSRLPLGVTRILGPHLIKLVP